ncbi:helix-loop-helix dna-binding domain protein [Moniliophthora roreri MCA 2997]|uniref:Helix-loop-helix dna-binding domain protein n=2 Tax=Moniliophthora roreri TaxID=221103 RepID=V2XM83_MONRO|nr:helix-loop-helix dna-binding domain protein [Moniliophthora roreri MCA 2997]KAI3607780.1 helix-loop-helix dna-binding domain protein [Moniliophthora roreri]
MSNLLSATETHEFHSFLTSIDYAASSDVRNSSLSEWSTYQSDHSGMLPEVPHAKGKEALARATKDLMSLDSNSWSSPSSTSSHFQHRTYSYGPQSSQPPQYGYDHSQSSSQNPLFQPQHHRHPIQQAPFPYPSKLNSAPLVSSHHSHPEPSGSSHHVPHPISIAPIHTLSAGANSGSSSSLRPYNTVSSPPTTSSSNSSYSFTGSSSGLNNGSSSATIPSPPSSESVKANATSEGTSSNKRPLDSTSVTNSANKRPRPSPPSATMNGTITPNKSTLLSPSQKKANHIQSEQKRRANIRRGYEALCETVPALREAIRLEEEVQVNAQNGARKANGRAKRGRGRGKVDEGTGEKIDGRAGPRSENIVLGKTIDYINELLNDRQVLLARLERARSALAPDHPSLQTPNTPPLWEQEWRGGSGKDADADEEDDEDDEE